MTAETVAAGPAPSPRATAAVVAATAVTVCAWASAFVVIRWVGESLAPGPLALGRLLLGAFALGGLLLAQGTWVAPSRRDWGLLVVCGVSWFALYNVSLNAAEQRIDAGTTAMLVNVGPILIGLFAAAVLGEFLSRWLIIGSVVAFGGAALVAVALGGGRDADAAGVALSLAAAAAYAVGVVAQKPLLHGLPALQVTWIACVVGAVACLPFLPALTRDLAEASVTAVGGLVYLGLVPTALAFTTWAYALARTDAARLGVATYLVPPITLVGAWLLLHEAPPVLALAGGTLCLVGVALSRWR